MQRYKHRHIRRRHVLIEIDAVHVNKIDPANTKHLLNQAASTAPCAPPCAVVECAGPSRNREQLAGNCGTFRSDDD